MFRVDKKKSILNQDQQIIKEKLCLLDSITTGNLIHIQTLNYHLDQKCFDYLVVVG